MIPDLALWQWAVAFGIGAAGLVWAGGALAMAGERLAQLTGLGRLFIGTLFLAVATSLPEAVTDVTAAAANAPDLAVADLFGSSMANMAILAIIDLSYRGAVWPAVELGHARVAAVGIGLTALAALAILTPPGASVGWVGVDTIAIAAAYIAAITWFHRSPGMPAGVPAEATASTQAHAAVDRGALTRCLLWFGIAAGAVFVSAPVVAVAAREIAHGAGIAETTVGTGLLAVTTSMPELIASLAAVRIGAHDLAVGNLFGSNAANMAVLLFADVAYRRGPILAAVDDAQLVAAVGAILLMSLAVAALVADIKPRLSRVEPDAVVLLFAYVGAIIAVAVAAQ